MKNMSAYFLAKISQYLLHFATSAPLRQRYGCGIVTSTTHNLWGEGQNEADLHGLQC